MPLGEGGVDGPNLTGFDGWTTRTLITCWNVMDGDFDFEWYLLIMDFEVCAYGTFHRL